MEHESGQLQIQAHTGTDLQALSIVENTLSDRGYVVIHVRAQYCGTYADLHREFAAAFQFPWYYGNNIPALGECLSEVGDTDPAVRGVVVSVWDCSALLAFEADRPDKLEVLHDVLENVAEEMANPSGIVVGETLTSRELVLLLHDTISLGSLCDRSLRGIIMELNR